ncbi:SIMPL domain-containing protein [Paenalcaligenes niemegkensis]|uniref:SIMPL domain-containing protein n=1 Tax=Paenalcaligenes niemegkensis TaxID=2895469 RepID=UPI001EE8DEED|nr:SIMPL domain-containing protein [Paenalcaligenes niemegkensis]MCQ9615305.1 SIMPL domain-containing protein [Paenalcaligenes niemegkensis]
MLKKRIYSTALLAAVFGIGAMVATSAQAHTDDESSYLAKRPPVVSLQSEAVTEVQQDTVTIYLATEFNEATQVKVDEQLRKVVDSVLAEAKKQTEIKVSSSGYQVYPTSDRKGAISGWRGRAELKLESTDIQAAGKLAAQLSDRMPVSRLSFSVSPQARAEYEKNLLKEAIDNFQARAQIISENMGFVTYRYKDVNVGGSGANYRPVMKQAMMASDSVGAAASAESLSLESGTENISVSVSGSIYLQNSK